MAWQDDVNTQLDAATAAIAKARDIVKAQVSTPAPTPAPAPAPTPTAGFVGRGKPDSTWKITFEDDFVTPVAEGKFLSSDYGKKWHAYPSNYTTTDHNGNYEPNHLSAIKTDAGESVLQCRLTPGVNGGKASGTAAEPMLGQATKGEIISARIKVAKTASGWHAANLGWPPNDSDWPKNGEPDWWESGLTANDTVGGWLHVQNGGSNGEGQVRLDGGSIKVTDWFVISAKRVPGKLYEWSVNGKVLTSVTSAVPTDFFRWVLQLETGGKPTSEAIVWYDWVTIWQPA